MNVPVAYPGTQDLDDALASLRVRVLRTSLNLLAIAVPALVLVVIISAALTNTLGPITVILSTFGFAFPILRLVSDRLGYRRTALTLLAAGALTGFIVSTRGGVGVGSVSMQVLVLMLSALFFGRRGAALALLAELALLGTAAVLIISGVGPPVEPNMWDPTSPVFWTRQIVGLALFGLAIAVTEVYVVEHLAQEAVRHRLLANREREQRLALERAELEREHEREQRQAAQKALEESRRIEALARLAGGVAHDFNNVLTVILGTAESIEMDPQDRANVESCAREIRDAAERAGDLTRQLLMLGRQSVTRPQAVAMAALVARLGSTLRRVLPSDIALEIETPASTVVARVDPVELERAVFNLVVNARDAMLQGGKVAISCRLEGIEPGNPVLAAGEYVVLSVSDTGVGMTAEIQQRIFDPFFTTKGPGAGAGLGLATVYAFTRESGGDVQVSSTPGAGTTFQLRLPVDMEGVNDPAERPPIQTSPMNGARARVLVVEDRDDVRATMMRTLRQGGFDVTEAADGDHALAVLSDQPPFNLMCIDGVMPKTTTRAVIETVEQQYPAVRILLVSGYLDEDLLRRGVIRGRYAFLQKPFSADALLQRVHDVLQAPR